VDFAYDRRFSFSQINYGAIRFKLIESYKHSRASCTAVWKPTVGGTLASWKSFAQKQGWWRALKDSSCQGENCDGKPMVAESAIVAL